MNILVSKPGALGDVVLAFQAFADIRAHHPGARITLLTTKSFASLHRPAKRWPAEHFGALATRLVARGLTPVTAGGASETPLAAAIRAICPAAIDPAAIDPAAIDFAGQTSLPELASLAAQATLAVGNDTGPMHLAAAVGCPGIVLFGPDNDPALTAPRGRMTVLRADRLSDLASERVAAGLAAAHTLHPQSPAESLPCPP